LNQTIGASEKYLECKDPNVSHCHVMRTFPNLSLGKKKRKDKGKGSP